MKVFKKFSFTLLGWFGPLVSFCLTNKILDCFKIVDKDVPGAIILAFLLLFPYLLFKRSSYVGKKTSKKYFIIQNLWLLFFSILAISASEFKYIINVWSLVFIGIRIVDNIEELQSEEP